MRDLAGSLTANDHIRMELGSAGIPIEDVDDLHGRVPATIIGQLGGFTFIRKRNYWVARGNAPVEFAEALQSTSVGRLFIKEVGSVFPANQSAAIYRIDSQDGLRFFVEMMKEHGLVPIAAA